MFDEMIDEVYEKRKGRLIETEGFPGGGGRCIS